MIYEEDLTDAQNAYLDATEQDIDNADVRLQHAHMVLAQEDNKDDEDWEKLWLHNHGLD